MSHRQHIVAAGCQPAAWTTGRLPVATIRRLAWTAALASVLLSAAPAMAADGLKCLQQPTFWVVGQLQRFLIETPADCGKLEIAHPGELVLVDRWPHKPGDTVQRFYLRAEKPFDDGKLVLSSGAYRFELPVYSFELPVFSHKTAISTLA